MMSGLRSQEEQADAPPPVLLNVLGNVLQQQHENYDQATSAINMLTEKCQSEQEAVVIWKWLNSTIPSQGSTSINLLVQVLHSFADAKLSPGPGGERVTLSEFYVRFLESILRLMRRLIRSSEKVLAELCTAPSHHPVQVIWNLTSSNNNTPSVMGASLQCLGAFCGSREIAMATSQRFDGSLCKVNDLPLPQTVGFLSLAIGIMRHADSLYVDPQTRLPHSLSFIAFAVEKILPLMPKHPVTEPTRDEPQKWRAVGKALKLVQVTLEAYTPSEEDFRFDSYSSAVVSINPPGSELNAEQAEALEQKRSKAAINIRPGRFVMEELRRSGKGMLMSYVLQALTVLHIDTVSKKKPQEKAAFAALRILSQVLEKRDDFIACNPDQPGWLQTIPPSMLVTTLRLLKSNSPRIQSGAGTLARQLLANSRDQGVSALQAVSQSLGKELESAILSRLKGDGTQEGEEVALVISRMLRDPLKTRSEKCITDQVAEQVAKVLTEQLSNQDLPRRQKVSYLQLLTEMLGSNNASPPTLSVLHTDLFTQLVQMGKLQPAIWKSPADLAYELERRGLIFRTLAQFIRLRPEAATASLLPDSLWCMSFLQECHSSHFKGTEWPLEVCKAACAGLEGWRTYVELCATLKIEHLEMQNIPSFQSVNMARILAACLSTLKGYMEVDSAQARPRMFFHAMEVPLARAASTLAGQLSPEGTLNKARQKEWSLSVAGGSGIDSLSLAVQCLLSMSPGTAEETRKHLYTTILFALREVHAPCILGSKRKAPYDHTMRNRLVALLSDNWAPLTSRLASEAANSSNSTIRRVAAAAMFEITTLYTPDDQEHLGMEWAAKFKQLQGKPGPPGHPSAWEPRNSQTK